MTTNTAALAAITGADHGIHPDSKDAEYLHLAVAQRELIDGPRVGDFVRFADGSRGRFTHSYGDAIQTTVRDGQFGEGGHYLSNRGHISYSGALDPAIPVADLVRTDEVAGGRVWFFHRDRPSAHSAVHAEIPCRVYREVKP